MEDNKYFHKLFCITINQMVRQVAKSCYPRYDKIVKFSHCHPPPLFISSLNISQNEYFAKARVKKVLKQLIFN